LLQAYCPKHHAGKQLWYCTSTYFAIFELIKFTCFGATLSYPHKKFLNPRPPVTRTRPANAGTRNPRGLTRPMQDSSKSAYSAFKLH